MKKFILIFATLFANLAVYAQDIIVTNDANKIEASVIEVGKTEIKYKRKGNSNGPTFVISTDDINSVIFANGEVMLFQSTDKNEESKKSPKNPDIETTGTSATIVLTSGETIDGYIQDMNNSGITYYKDGTSYNLPAAALDYVELSSGQVKLYRHQPQQSTVTVSENKAVSYLSRNGNSYYYEGRKMRGDEYEFFLRQHCSFAYEQYCTGQVIAAIGWTFLALGVGIDVGLSWWIPYTWIPALGLELACIPTLCVGYGKMHKTVDTFNNSCAKKNSQAYWSVNASANGIGLAFNF